MSIKFGNRSVRGRLLSLVALIVVPLTALGSYLAFQNNRLIAANVTEARARISEDFTFRTRLWFRGMLRAAEALAATAENGTGEDWRHAYCEGDGRAVVAASATFQALIVHGPADEACHVLGDGAADATPYVAASRRILALPSLESWGPPLASGFRYSSVQIGASVFGVVQYRGGTTGSIIRAISLFFPMSQLANVFNPNNQSQQHTVGLVSVPGLQLLAARGPMDKDLNWLPRDVSASGVVPLWSGISRDGRQFTYFAREVVPSEMIILAAFSDREIQLAQLQLMLLAGAPMALLLLFMLAYWQFVNHDIGRSIDSIEVAARRAADGDFEARANVDDAMPLELRRAGEGVNKIIDAAQRRNGQLMEAATRNADLMRELHHRVKNSLQVVQSYLAITRRTLPNRESETLREAEAKVQVLSTAYRYALTDKGLRPVPLRLYMAELLSDLTRAAARTDRAVTGSISTHAQLEVDRAIPLGLAVAEVAFNAIRSKTTGTVHIDIADAGADVFGLIIKVSGKVDAVALNARTLSGLRVQLGALEDGNQAGELLRWSIGVTHRG